ncbi:MAG: citrate synthase [Candidatus Thermofonsia Clade 1 bacterium]|uniref:Citrate synthase n=1 Tax=Candidatus Thermofonsia Clade 1 bacterium TaxID=2364210 RepID=A0A2M8P3Z5_9CHLR|nr:MAG: citrate synthase [Candidatus Thermofonsia Clade 1 bacterium]
MTDKAAAAAKGLQNVVVGQTRLSLVNGTEGKLIYVGYKIEDLAEHASFEEVIYLLWHGQLPNRQQLTELRQALQAEMYLPAAVMGMLYAFPKDATPMAVLRTAVSMLALYDPKADDNSVEENRRKALQLTAKVPVIVAAWERARNGKEPIPARPDYSFAQNFLWMLKGTEPQPQESAVIDAYLVLLSEHGMNASTFSARVTTSTLSDMYSAMTTAIGTLKGAAHGGANEEAMRMFFEIGSADNVENWFNTYVKTKQKRVMGMGHRVYKALDPRAAVLRRKAEEMSRATNNMHWFDLAVKLEEVARQDPEFIEKKLYPNVDYYSAIALYTLGIPMDQFTPLFAIARMPGWTAHVMEQWADNRLIRPDVEYIGPMDLEWKPLDQR